MVPVHFKRNVAAVLGGTLLALGEIGRALAHHGEDEPAVSLISRVPIFLLLGLLAAGICLGLAGWLVAVVLRERSAAR